MSVDKSLNVQLKDYDVQEIAAGIYKINEYNLSTMFVINGSERALVLDCGVGVGDFKAVVEKLTGGKPYDLVLTHGHVDHAGGRGQFEKLYVSPADFSEVPKATLFYRKFYIFVMRYLMFFKCITYKKAVMKKVETEPEYVPVAEGDKFELGGKTIKVFECPGHTVGSLCFLDEQEKILFSGDCFNPLLLMFLPHATTIESYINTVQKVITIDGYDKLWASHLASPLTRADAEAIGLTAQRIVKKHKFNFLPLVAISSVNKYSIIYRLDRVRDKRKKGKADKTV